MLEVAAVAEQSSASTEEVSASTQETSASTQEIAASAQELSRTAEELEQLVGALHARAGRRLVALATIFTRRVKKRKPGRSMRPLLVALARVELQRPGARPRAEREQAARARRGQVAADAAGHAQLDGLAHLAVRADVVDVHVRLGVEQAEAVDGEAHEHRGRIAGGR